MDTLLYYSACVYGHLYRRTHTHILQSLQSLPQYLSLSTYPSSPTLPQYLSLIHIHPHQHFPFPFPFHTYKIQFSFIQKKTKTIQKKNSNHEKYCNQRTMFRPTPFDSFRRHFLICIMVEIFVICMQKTKHLHLSTTKSIEFHYLTFFNINTFRLATVVPIVFLLKNPSANTFMYE